VSFRIDKSGTGCVPRKLFIEGVLTSKFPTTPLEMARVADEFDKGDGMISSKEFMNALRFNPNKMVGLKLNTTNFLFGKKCCTFSAKNKKQRQNEFTKKSLVRRPDAHALTHSQSSTFLAKKIVYTTVSAMEDQ
jgi:hypothetical protein